MLPKRFRLSPKQFQRVYKQGKKARGEFGMLISLNDASQTSPKMGIVVNSKVGNSVFRHRLTRKIRAISTPHLKNLEYPTLFEYVAFKYTDDFSLLEKEISSQFNQLLKK